MHTKPHAPLVQVAPALATDVVQATALPHAPVEPHVSALSPEHCVAPGAQTPVQAPPTHAWLMQAAAVPHEPVEVHVSTPLLLGSHRVAPGTQTPPQLVPTQASAHVVGAAHSPLVVQVSCWVSLVHCVAPGAQTPVQAPPTHALLTQAAAVPHEPVEVHVSTPLLLGSHCVVPGAQTSMIAPHTLALSTEQPLLQALALWPAVQFAVQELAFSHAVQFAVQELAFWPAVQYAVQELAFLPQLQFCVQLLQLPVHTQSPVQLLQSPATTVALVRAALLVPTPSVVEGAELHATIVRHEKRMSTNDFMGLPPRRAAPAPIEQTMTAQPAVGSKRPAGMRSRESLLRYSHTEPAAIVISLFVRRSGPGRGP